MGGLVAAGWRVGANAAVAELVEASRGKKVQMAKVEGSVEMGVAPVARVVGCPARAAGAAGVQATAVAWVASKAAAEMAEGWQQCTSCHPSWRQSRN